MYVKKSMGMYDAHQKKISSIWENILLLDLDDLGCYTPESIKARKTMLDEVSKMGSAHDNGLICSRKSAEGGCFYRVS